MIHIDFNMPGREKPISNRTSHLETPIKSRQNKKNCYKSFAELKMKQFHSGDVLWRNQQNE